MCMKSILLYFVKFQVANLYDDFVPFFNFFHFFPKWKGRKYFFCIRKTLLPWLLPYMEEACQPCLENESGSKWLGKEILSQKLCFIPTQLSQIVLKCTKLKFSSHHTRLGNKALSGNRI